MYTRLVVVDIDLASKVGHSNITIDMSFTISMSRVVGVNSAIDVSALGDSCRHESQIWLARIQNPRLVFRMILYADVPRMVFQLDHFHADA